MMADLESTSVSVKGASASPPASRPPNTVSPGIRASTLQKVYLDALSHTLKNCTYANFAACFPTAAQYVPSSLDGFHREFVSRLEEACKTEFNSLMEARGVVSSLNELDELVDEARNRKKKADASGSSSEGAPTPPHLMAPAELLNAHLGTFLDSQAKEVQVQVESWQKGNKEMSEEINIQREEVERLLSGLETVVHELESANAEITGSEEMKRVEADLEKAAASRSST